jgi:hypothetical protein
MPSLGQTTCIWTMWTGYDFLPAEVVCQHVLCLLSLKELVQLDNAVIEIQRRKFLHECLGKSSVASFQLRKYNVHTSARWLYRRSISVRELDVCWSSSQGQLQAMAIRIIRYLVVNSRTIMVESCGLDDDSEILEMFAAVAHKVVSVDVTCINGVELLSTLGRGCCNLTKLHVTEACTTEPLDRFFAAFSSWDKVMAVSITVGCMCNDDADAFLLERLQLCQNVKQLTCPAEMLNDDSLRALMTAFRNLEELFITTSKELGDASIEELSTEALSVIAEHCPNLRRLDAPNLRVEDTSVVAQLCTGCPNLTALNLHSPTLTMTALAVLVQCAPHLEELGAHKKIFESDPSTTLWPAQEENHTLLLPRLRRLEITGFPRRKHAATFRRIAQVASNAQHLTIRPEYEWDYKTSIGLFITEADLTALSEYCRDLRTFHVACCFDITDVGVTVLVQSNPHLQSLRLRHATMLSSASLQCLATHCPQVQELYLHRWRTVSDAGVIAVLRSCCFLHTLKLLDCEALTDATLGAIVQYRANDMTDITVAECPRLTGNALVRVGLACPKLRTFVIESNYFTEEHYKQLESLTVRGVFTALSWEDTVVDEWG